MGWLGEYQSPTGTYATCCLRRHLWFKGISRESGKRRQSQSGQLRVKEVEAASEETGTGWGCDAGEV
jgi:hypothetical protein